MNKHFLSGFSMVVSALCVASCTPPPPVEQSRDVLWQQFAHQPVDKVLMAWGPPAGETRLTNGTRMVTYRRQVIYNDRPSASCEVSFFAPPPAFRIEDIAMKGAPYECQLLSQGERGNMYVNDPPPPPVFYPVPTPYPYRYR